MGCENLEEHDSLMGNYWDGKWLSDAISGTFRYSPPDLGSGWSLRSGRARSVHGKTLLQVRYVLLDVNQHLLVILHHPGGSCGPWVRGNVLELQLNSGLEH